MAELVDGKVATFTLTPEQVRLKRHTKDELRGGEPEFNARALRSLLSGAPGAYRDTVLMNAGAGLVVAGKAANLEDGIQKAAGAIDSGRARKVLDMLVKVSNE